MIQLSGKPRVIGTVSVNLHFALGGEIPHS
jgi:hypothetical protein